MNRRALSLAPLASVFFALLAFFTGYGIAVAKDHVDPWLPYISDCGNLPPESCIFGIFLSIASVLFLLTVYYIHQKILRNTKPKTCKKAYLLLLIGWITAIGMLIVANFQEGNVLVAHDSGAFMFFFGIIIYIFVYSLICTTAKPMLVPVHLTLLRIVLNLLALAILIFHIVCLFCSPFVKAVDGIKPDKPYFPNGIERYRKGDTYYSNHLASTISEWALVFIMLLQILSLTSDLIAEENRGSESPLLSQSTASGLHSETSIKDIRGSHAPQIPI